MPMAESRAPIVVGMRHTSSATRITTDTDPPAKAAKGCSTTTTGRKMMVSTAKRMVRAISLASSGGRPLDQ